MVDRKQTFEEIIEEAVHAKLKKVQILAVVKLEKSALEDEAATGFTFHVKSKMETVYLGESLTENPIFKTLQTW